MRVLSYSEVQEEFPEAWKALPVPYQNDSCLSFYQDDGGMLWAQYDLGGEFAWLSSVKVWEEV